MNPTNMFNPANPIGLTSPLSPFNPNGLVQQNLIASAQQSYTGEDQSEVAYSALGLLILAIGVLVVFCIKEVNR